MSLSVRSRGRTVAARGGAADGNYCSGVAARGTYTTDIRVRTVAAETFRWSGYDPLNRVMVLIFFSEADLVKPKTRISGFKLDSEHRMVRQSVHACVRLSR